MNIITPFKNKEVSSSTDLFENVTKRSSFLYGWLVLIVVLVLLFILSTVVGKWVNANIGKSGEPVVKQATPDVKPELSSQLFLQ